MLHQQIQKLFRAGFLAGLIILLGLLSRHPHQVGSLYAQEDVLIPTLVLLLPDSKTDPADSEAVGQKVEELVELSGGRVVHSFPPYGVIARVPTGVESGLASLSGVALVSREPIELATVDVYGVDARRLANMWNNLVSPAPPEHELSVAEQPTVYQDALVAPDLPLNAEGVQAASATPGYYQTSEYMTGSVAVGIVLVESDGSIDPSTENWTSDEKQQVFNEIVAGLNWWSELEPRANLSFVYDDHASNPLPTGVEPITRPYYDQRYWIKDSMQALGYVSSSYFGQVRDYNNALRATYQTDWAFTIFVVDSSADADNYFSKGYFAYAYLGGPFLVMTYGNNGYGPHNMDAVTAHEVGHIFYALDQYSGARQPCTRTSGYLNVENQNSLYGGCSSNVASIMRGLVYPYTAQAIDPFAAGQIGWRDSDGDQILDPLDTELPVTIDNLVQNGEVVTVTGAAEIVPYPSPTRSSITINRLVEVQYRFDGGSWQQAIASDGLFDETSEQYHFTSRLDAPGFYTLEVKAVDSAGNSSGSYASETIIIFDPLDGGLNTVLFEPEASVLGVSASISGLAYHLPERTVSKVEYRVDDGPWRSVTAQDGAFDSNYESFTLTLDSLEAGAYLIEARATDAHGYEETNVASLIIEARDPDQHTLFLPLVSRGM